MRKAKKAPSPEPASAAKPFLSVIIPVYNAASYLQKNVDSLLADKFEDFELILINDGSTDGSLEIVQSFSDPRVSFVSQENRGAGASRNTGLDLAQGEYLLFLDADDEYEPDILHTIATALKRKKLPDILFWKFLVKEANGEGYFLGMPHVKSGDLENINFASGGCNYNQISSPSPFNKAFKRSFIKAHDIRFQEISSCNDIAFVWLALEFSSSSYYLDRLLLKYSRHVSNSISSQRFKKALNIVHAGEYIRERLEKKGRPAQMRLYYSIAQNMAWERMQFPPTDDASALEEAIRAFLPPEAFVNYEERVNAYRERLQPPRPAKPPFPGEPELSFIIPVYNAEKFLPKAIDSILQLKDVNYELICVDDGSTDDSWSILKKYANAYKNFYAVCQSNRGQAAARNRGLALARGKYIQFVDADDYIDASKLNRILEFMKQEELDMCSFSGQNFENGALKAYPYWEYRELPERYFNTPLNIRDILDYLVYLPVSTVLTIYRRDFLRAINNEFPEGFIFEDNYFFTHALLNCGKYAVMKESVYRRILHGGQTTQRNDKKLFDAFEMKKRCFDLYYERTSRGLALLYANLQRGFFNKLLASLDAGEKEEFSRQILKFYDYCLHKGQSQ